MLRIEAGSLKGAKLVSPKGDATRPTTGKVRAAVGDALFPKWTDARVLDLFAGSGVNGLEAISRGARNVVFVEKDRAALQVIRRNICIARERISDENFQPVIVASAVEKAWKRIQHKGLYDVIWADPPYKHWSAIWSSIEFNVTKCLATSGIFVVEHSKEFRPLEAGFSDKLSIKAEKRYGETLVSIFEKKGSA